MAPGKKTGGRSFGLNNPPPKSPGRPRIPKETKDLIKLDKKRLFTYIHKYSSMSMAEAREIERKLAADNEAMDKLSMIEMGMMRAFFAFARGGQVEHIEFWLNHLIGRAPQAVALTGPNGGAILTSHQDDLRQYSKQQLEKLLEKIKG